MKIPVSSSVQPSASMTSSYMPVNVSNNYPTHLQAGTHAPLVNETPLSQFTTNQLAASASQLVSSMESQLNQESFMLEPSNVDTSSRLDHPGKISSSFGSSKNKTRASEMNFEKQ